MNEIASAFVKTDGDDPVTLVQPGLEKEFLDLLLKNLDVGVAILDKDMRYRLMSGAVRAQLGIGPDDIKLGDPLSKMHEVMSRNGMMTPEIMAKNKLSENEQRENAKDGTGVSTRLVKLGNGTTHRFCRQVLDNGYTISVSSDVSELVEKDDMLEASLSLGRSGIWVYDFRTKTYQLSKSLKQYFGKEGTKVVLKKGFISRVHPEDKTKFQTVLKDLPKTNDQCTFEGRVLTGKGNLRWCHTTVELIRDAHGRPLQIRAFVRDTNRERKQKEKLEEATEEAIRASRAKSEFLANMSHEIRTPMNGILGMAELLAGSNIDERQKEYLDVITNSASALLCIINDILDFSKIEAGALELDPIPFDLKSSINDVTSLLIPNAQEKGLELIIDYPSDLPRHFIGDAGRIRQILTNLAGNAIKFTSEGHVQVDVRIESDSETPDRPFVTLDVCDTGIGIDADKLDAIFDKFTQADGSTTRVYGGTGLGLAITKSIAELMGGEIRVSSKLGVGSKFGVRIPLPIDHNAKAENFCSVSLKGKRALIVDDIDVNRRVLSDQVAGWGMTSAAVENGVKAVEALKAAAGNPHEAPYDVILLDYLMPGVNGRELASMLSSQSSVLVPPIVMLSSCDQSVSSQELGKIGINSYLVKPVRERRLFDTLGRMLGQYSAENPATIVPPVEIAETEPLSDLERVSQILGTEEISGTDNQTEPAFPIGEVSVSENPETVPSAAPVAAVKLPIPAPSPAPTPAPVPSPETPPAVAHETTSGKQEILVAEDFPLNQDVVRLMLAETAFAPVFAENGKVASDLYLAGPNRFPLILMDVSMPVMDGYQATGVIRDWEAQNSSASVPIIALTGHALKNDRQACLDAGMTDYLTKPVKQAELLELLEHYSGRAVDIGNARVA